MKNYWTSFTLLIQVIFSLNLNGCYRTPTVPTEPVYNNKYDPQSPTFDDSLAIGRWTTLQQYSTSLYSQRAVFWANMFILLGGLDVSGGIPRVTDRRQHVYFIDTLEIYDGRPMLARRISFSVTTVSENYSYLVFGGDSLGSVEMYDLWTYASIRLGYLPSENLTYGSFAVRKQGSPTPKVLVGGGYSLSGVMTNEIWMFDLALNTWSLFGHLPHALKFASAQILGNQLFVIGGFDSTNRASSQIYVGNLDSLSWNVFQDTLRTPRGNSVSLVRKGRIYVFGGETSPGTYSNAVDEIKTEKGKCISKSPLPFYLALYGCGVVYSGEMYLVGGGQGGTTILRYDLPY